MAVLRARYAAVPVLAAKGTGGCAQDGSAALLWACGRSKALPRGK